MSYLIAAIGFLIVIFLETSFFYISTGNPFFRFDSLSDYYNDPAVSKDFYGRLTFPKFFVTWPFVVFGSIQLGYFYGFIFLALFYWSLNRKKNTNYLLIWFLSIALYFYFGSTSLTRYAPVLAVDRYLSYITFPGLLLLSSFLNEKAKVIKSILMPFAILFLIVTSLGASYLDEGRHSQESLSKAYEYLKPLKSPVYTDSRSKAVMEYLDGFGNAIDVNDFQQPDNYKNSFLTNLSNAGNSYIVLNKGFISQTPSLGRVVEFPEEAYNPPKKWAVVKEIGNDPDKKIVIYYTK